MTTPTPVAIVTGGATGIGRSTAQQLINRGYSVVLVGRREAMLATASKELDASGKRVAFVAGDVGIEATATRAVELAQKKFGAVTALVNAAGIFTPKPFLDHRANDLDAYLGTILKGTFFMSQAVAAQFKSGGSIVNVGSMWAMQGVAATPCAAYAAAKGAVHTLTRTLAIELAPAKIRVNAVAPGVVETPVYESFIPREQVSAALAGFAGFQPLGRIGQPDELAQAIVFLLEASWVTGVVLPVDGGVMAGRH